MSEDLIRRSDAIKAVAEYISCDYATEEMATESATLLIDTIPTIEPKRGEWVREINDYDHAYHNRCSVCSEWNGLDVEGWNWTPNFCPNCGADMRGVDDE